MKSFFNRLKTERRNLNLSLLRKLEASRFGMWLNSKPDTWYWYAFAAVTVFTLGMVVRIPIDIMAFFKAFKKDTVNVEI